MCGGYPRFLGNQAMSYKKNPQQQKNKTGKKTKRVHTPRGEIDDLAEKDMDRLQEAAGYRRIL